MIWFTSDLHLGHEAIIRMQNRPFQNIDEMNNTLIHNLNECVRANDKLYILGDISHHIDAEDSNALIKRIHGQKNLILGNHDVTGDPEVCRYNPNLFQWIGPYLKITASGMTLILMHYPMLTWAKVRAGSVMLHGHIHSGPEYNEANQQAGIRRFDVGVDANNYYPVSIDQIKAWAAKIPVAVASKTEELRAVTEDVLRESSQKVLEQNREAYKLLEHKNYKKTGEMLGQRRRQLYLTQQQVADKALISLRQYQRFEAEERDIMNASFDTACRVIKALDMDISDFYCRFGPEYQNTDK